MDYAAEKIYKKLFAAFGPQRWWPAEGAFEVIVGAILTQNTSWKNVEKAISGLKKNGLLNPLRLKKARYGKLSRIIRPAGYYNIKAKRLKEFLKFFFGSYQGSIKRMCRADQETLRNELLQVKGIGPETADSILLYALNKPAFVVDAYTRRILTRHGLIEEGIAYEDLQGYFINSLDRDVRLFNEYHALLVKLGKEFCLKSKPKCKTCPLN